MKNDIKRKVYIKLYYSLLDWEWYSDTNTFRVFMHLLLTANRKDQPFRGDVIRRGESLSSLEYIAAVTGLSIQNVRRAIENLIETKEITKRKIGLNNIYKVENFAKWQDGNGDSDSESTSVQQQINSESTLVQQQINNTSTTVQQQINNTSTTFRYCNNEENEENERMRECEEKTHARGRLKNVFITDKEYEEFRKQYITADEIIDELSAKIATGDLKYRTGHIGHLYVFAKNNKNQKRAEQIAYDIDMVMKRARALDPTKTKRTQ